MSLQHTNLHILNLCTIHIRPYTNTGTIMGFCTLLETAVVPADVVTNLQTANKFKSGHSILFAMVNTRERSTW